MKSNQQQPSPPPSCETIQKLLQTLHPCSRKIHDLHEIYNYVSTCTDIKLDPLWNFCNKPQQLVFCRYMQLYHVFDEEHHSIFFYRKNHDDNHNDENVLQSNNGWQNTRFLDTKLFVLLRGNVTISSSFSSSSSLSLQKRQKYSISLSGQRNQQQGSGACFGNLYLPKRVQNLVLLNHQNTNEVCGSPAAAAATSFNHFISQLEENNFDRDDDDDCISSTTTKKKTSTTNLLNCVFRKGAIYIAISTKDVKIHLQKLIHQVASFDVLHHFRLTDLQKCFTYRSIPAETTLLKQGYECRYIYLVLQGSCLLLSSSSPNQQTQSNQKEEKQCHVLSSNNAVTKEMNKCSCLCPNGCCCCITHHIGTVGPMSFLGLIPHFTKMDSDDSSGGGGNHLSLDKMEDDTEHHEGNNADITTMKTQPLSVISATPVQVLMFPAAKFVESISRDVGVEMKNAFESLAKQQRQWLENVILPPATLEKNKNDHSHDYDDDDDMVQNTKDVNSKSDNYCQNDKVNDYDSSSSSITASSSKSFLVDMERILQMRVKKRPKLNRTKFLREWKRLITHDESSMCNWEEDEYEEPQDPFSRFDFIDNDIITVTSECYNERNSKDDDSSSFDPMDFLEFIPPISPLDYISSSDDDDNTIAIDMLSPFPSILLDRKRHGKTLPVVKKSHGFLNPFLV